MKILICEMISREGREKLNNAGLEIDIQTGISRETLLEIIHEYEAVIISDETMVDVEFLNAAANLKIIAKAGSSFENIDRKACDFRDIKIIHTPGISANAVAELIIGLMIDLVRGITFADKCVRAGNYKFARQIGFELMGKTASIIGLGPIGRAVAEKCTALGMQVLGHTKIKNKDLFDNLKLVNFEEAMRVGDIVIFTIPRTEKTFHVISQEEIKLLKEGVIVVNASHSGVVEESALANGLKCGKIRAVALDAFEEFPMNKKHPFSCFDNVILTPHLGALTEETQKRISIEIADKLIKFVGQAS